MNITYHQIPLLADLPPSIEQFGHDFIVAGAYLLIPAELLYFAIYFHLKGLMKLFNILAWLSLATLWLGPRLAPISCGPARCLQSLAGW